MATPDETKTQGREFQEETRAHRLAKLDALPQFERYPGPE